MSELPGSGESAFASHLSRWRAHEPEMQFAEPFVPVALRPRFRAWGTLLVELERSLFGPSDPQVAAQRLAWWHGELRAHAPQHPVARALQEAGVAPGLASPVAGAAALLAQADESPMDTEAALHRFGDLADAVAAAEQGLFPGAGDAVAASRAIALGTLVRWLPRLPQHPLLREHLPLHLLARHPATAQAASARSLAVDLARELRALQPPAAPLPLYRALRWRFDRHRLRQLADGTVAAPEQCVPSPLRATWLAWTVARRDAGAGAGVS